MCIRDSFYPWHPSTAVWAQFSKINLYKLFISRLSLWQIDCKLESLPTENSDAEINLCAIERPQTNCTIFLGYTSNIISSGVRDILRYLAQHNMVSYNYRWLRCKDCNEHGYLSVSLICSHILAIFHQICLLTMFMAQCCCALYILQVLWMTSHLHTVGAMTCRVFISSESVTAQNTASISTKFVDCAPGKVCHLWWHCI